MLLPEPPSVARALLCPHTARARRALPVPAARAAANARLSLRRGREHRSASVTFGSLGKKDLWEQRAGSGEGAHRATHRTAGPAV